MEPTQQATPNYQIDGPSFGTRLKDSLVELIQFIAIVASILMIIRVLIAEPHRVSGNSMLPNFHDNDYIITNKLSVRLSTPKRGEVIIIKNPRNPEKDVFIKRVIGLPGETIKLLNGSVYINGTLLQEPYLEDGLQTPGEGFLKEGDEVYIPQGNYFVMGDNRRNSSDSRDFGLVKEELLIGQAELRYWPIQKAMIIPVGAKTN
ncbi:MAG: signal peptidase I [Candidatus Daviesbacteria bacterium]|nr:signal peptidase I [Candidatus Daviesbacteria bacterium]